MKLSPLFAGLLWACGSGSPPDSDSKQDSGEDSGAPPSLWCAEPADEVSYTQVGETLGLLDTTASLEMLGEFNPVVMADLDADGLDDLILALHHDGIWVQMNRGDQLESQQVSTVREVTGLALGDVDGNGTLDLWAGGRFGEMKIFSGDGSGGFEDVTNFSGLSGLPSNPEKKDAVFGDFDGDGDQDLFVNMATLPQNADESTMDKLFRNRGDGSFEHVSHWLDDASRQGLGWSSIWTDFDLDGDLDLFTANADQDRNGPSRLLRNDGAGPDDSWIFTDISETCFCTTNNSPMGVSAGDWNNDGLFDLFLTNTGANQLLQNAGDESFIDVGSVTGGMPMASLDYMTYGAAWLDYDNDGWQDLFMSAGPLGPANGQAGLAEQPDIFLRNDGAQLEDIAPDLGMDSLAVGRGVSVGMLNDDGFLDIAVLNLAAPSFLYQATCTESRALVVDLEGRPPNTFGVGSRIVVETDEGSMHREVTTKAGWGGSMHPRAYFGLGQSRVQSVTVYWLGGEAQAVEVEPGVDGRIRVVQD